MSPVRKCDHCGTDPRHEPDGARCDVCHTGRFFSYCRTHNKKLSPACGECDREREAEARRRVEQEAARRREQLAEFERLLRRHRWGRFAFLFGAAPTVCGALWMLLRSTMNFQDEISRGEGIWIGLCLGIVLLPYFATAIRPVAELDGMFTGIVLLPFFILPGLWAFVLMTEFGSLNQAIVCLFTVIQVIESAFFLLDVKYGIDPIIEAESIGSALRHRLSEILFQWWG
jgi:hypothetical protein